MNYSDGLVGSKGLIWLFGWFDYLF